MPDPSPASSWQPLVTIVIPCYNYSQYLQECIGSVLAQTYVRWELFVVDDASTSGDVAAEVGKFPDQRIRLITHERNKGLAASRNSGIRAGTGELVLPLDADDKLAPAYLEKLMPLLRPETKHNAAFCDFRLFGARDGLMGYRLRDVRTLLLEQWIPGPGSLFLRSLYERVGGYFNDLRAGNEDWDFWLGAAEHGLNAAFLPDPLYYYRQHGGSLAYRQRSTEYATRELLFRRHQALFDQYGLGGRFRAEGYRRTATAALRSRQLALATRMALRGVILSPLPFLNSLLRPLRHLSRS